MCNKSWWVQFNWNSLVRFVSNDNNVTCFNSFSAEHIPKEIKKFIRNKINANIYKIQPYDSIMCGYFYIEFIDVMLNNK